MGVCEINKTMLPLKAGYFLYFAGLACMFPYLPVYFVSLGLTIPQVGLLRGIDPILMFACTPLWGGIADKFSKHRLCLTIATIGTCVFYFAFMFVPYIAPLPQSLLSPKVYNVSPCSWESVFSERPLCRGDPPVTFHELTADTGNSTYPNDFCDQVCYAGAHARSDREAFGVCSSVEREGDTDWRCLTCGIGEFETEDGHEPNFQHLVLIHCRSDSLYRSLMSNDRQEQASGQDLLSYVDYEVCSKATCCECGIETTKEGTQRRNQTAFLICFILVFLSNAFDSAILPYMDAAIMDLLGDNEQDYGKQRLWGAIGWGLVAFIGGLAVDIVTRASGSSYFRYEPLFVIFAFTIVLFLFVTFFIKLPKHRKPQHMGKDLLVLCRRPAVLVFVAVIAVEGISLAMSYSFVMIYWQMELGASITLLGFSILVATLAETPGLFISGWVIERIGYQGVVYSTLAAFAARYICYGLIKNPWAVLPIQLLHGVTFGIGWPGFTMYANQIAPEGMSATLQALKTSAYFGIGFVIGNFVGGFIYEEYGARPLFFGNAALCGLMALVFYVAERLLGGLDSRDPAYKSPDDVASEDAMASEDATSSMEVHSLNEPKGQKS